MCAIRKANKQKQKETRLEEDGHVVEVAELAMEDPLSFLFLAMPVVNILTYLPD